MQLLTVKEVSKRLKVRPDFVYQLIRDGRLTAYKLSERNTRVAETDVEKLLREASTKIGYRTR